MNDFVRFMDKIIDLFQMEFVMYGHSISFWDIFIWFLVVSTVISFIVNVLKN